MDLTDQPPTPAQVRLLLTGFQKLGYGRRERQERLAVAAAAIGADSISSFADLTGSQARRLIGCLRRGTIPAAGSDLLLHEGWELVPEDQGHGRDRADGSSRRSAGAVLHDPVQVQAATRLDVLRQIVILFLATVLVLREIRRQQRPDGPGSSGPGGAR